MKKISLFITTCGFLTAVFWTGPAALAQETEGNPTPDATIEQNLDAVTLKAEAGKDQNAVIGRKILFDASGSSIPKDTQATYAWDFGDGSTGSGIDPTHIYNRSGVFRVTLHATVNNTTSTDSLIISVAENLAILITDGSINETEIKKIFDYALTQNVLVVNIRDDSNDSNYIIAQNLGKKLLLSQNDLKQAELIIVMTQANVGLNALAELAQAYDVQKETTLTELKWDQKTIVNVTGTRSSAARIAQSTFNFLEPNSILLVNEDAVFPVVSAGKTKNAIPTLQNHNLDYEIISQFSQRALEELTPFNFMSYGINYLINRGLDQNTLLLILSLPVIATLIVIARQIIGVKAFGIHIPSMIALTFVVTGLKYGLIIFIALFITGTLARIAARRLRLLYLPRMAILLTVVSLSIVGLFIITAASERTGFLTISIFPILILTLLIERFVEAQIEKGFRTAAKLTIESLVLSIISYYIVTWQTLQNIILGYPELILLLVIFNLLLGRFTGLRLTEYLRFFNLFKHDRQSEAQKDSRNE